MSLLDIRDHKAGKTSGTRVRERCIQFSGPDQDIQLRSLWAALSYLPQARHATNVSRKNSGVYDAKVRFQHC